MCGIFGYIGLKNAVNVTLAGLKKLEYRGYDSAGIATLQDQEILFCKEVGKLAVLERAIRAKGWNTHIAIGHTRWATHGIPSAINAHPQFDSDYTVAIIHNGIFENQAVLRKSLLAKGAVFISDTDTEVVAHLIADHYDGDLYAAVCEIVPLLEGAFAFVALHRDHPDQLIAVSNYAPLVIGLGDQETFVSSDIHAFAMHTKRVLFLDHGEIARLSAGEAKIFNKAGEEVRKSAVTMEIHSEELTKGGFEHYTLKEIYQQPQALQDTLAHRLLEEYGSAQFGAAFDVSEFVGIERILILGCGSSWHAGLLGGYMLEDRARIPVQVEVASEFRYKNPIVPQGTFVIALSQSGETADTLAAIREVKAKGSKVVAICNVPGSTMARESNAVILQHAGTEVGVCSTKAFTSQVVILALLTLLMARTHHMSKQEGQEWIRALRQLPGEVQIVLDQAPLIEKIAKKYAKYDNAFFIGRRYMFPTSLEGALKLKEISYVNASGYPAGELKHGPLALLSENCPVIAFCGNKATFHKMQSNLTEAAARGSPLLAIAEIGQEVEHLTDDVIWVPPTLDELAAVPAVVAAQLFAYYVAKQRGTDIDKPRNLAKSVTVE